MAKIMDENAFITIPDAAEPMSVRVITLDETTSTNDFLKCCPMPEDTDMLVLAAQHQTAGRGQGSNKWESAAGENLLFSILVEPTMVPIAQQFVLSMACALALKEALSCYAEGFSLKWPNDIYWQDRKISGTLIETSVTGRTLTRCVFGSGININQQQFHSDAPNPVSLFHIIGSATPTEEVLQAVLQAFAKYYNKVAKGLYLQIEQLYHESLYRCEGWHEYRDSEGLFIASIDRVGLDGRLHLTLQDGSCRSYAFKEVAFVLPENL